MFKNDGIVYSNRCHETIEDYVNKYHRKSTIAPILIKHFGYMKEKSHVDRKLKLYNKLNKLRIKDNPRDPRPYFDIALQRLNDGDVDGAIELMEKSKSLGPDLYLPRKELGLIYMRLGLKNLEEALERMPDTHPMKSGLVKYFRELDKLVEPEVKVGSAQGGDDA